VKLSPKGRAVQRRAEKALDKVADSFFGALSDDERAELRRLLLKLIEGRGSLAEHLADEAHD
jgi:DNA-binding MarR family transcriptional regulator